MMKSFLVAVALGTAALGAMHGAQAQQRAISVSEGLGDFESRHGRWIAERTPYFGIVHGDPRTVGLPDLVARLSEISASFLVGGLSASRSGRDGGSCREGAAAIAVGLRAATRRSGAARPHRAVRRTRRIVVLGP